MFVLSVVAVWYQYGHVPAEPFINMILENDDGTMNAAGQFLKIGVTVGYIISAFYVGALILLLQLKPVQTLLAPLKYYGRMALTNYIGQTAMILIAGSVFNFAENLTYMQTLYVCIAIYAIQILFSVIWMKVFKMITRMDLASCYLLDGNTFKEIKREVGCSFCGTAHFIVIFSVSRYYLSNR